MDIQTLRDFIAANLTVELISDDVSGIMVDVANGKYALNERLSPGYQVRDLRACPGFWLVPQLGDDMIATYIGRWCRGAAAKLNVDLAKMSMPQKIELMQSTNQVQQDALEPTIRKAFVQLGKAVPTEQQVETMLTKIMGSQAYAEQQLKRPMQH